MTIQKKLIVVGNCYSKINVLCTYDRGLFMPYIEQNNPHKYPSELYVPLDYDEIVEFKVVNVCHRDEYQRLRPEQYQNSNVILACFGIDNRSSLHFLVEKFRYEATWYCPETPILLVGIKSDLRDNIEQLENLVSVEEGIRVAQILKAIGYMECSPKTYHNVDQLFQMAAEIALLEKPRKKKEKRRFGCFF